MRSHKITNYVSSGFFSLYLVSIPLPALAYVDPGFGSLVLQALAASAVGAVFYFRQVRDAVLSIFRRTKKTADKNQAADSDEDTSV